MNYFTVITIYRKDLTVFEMAFKPFNYSEYCFIGYWFFYKIVKKRKMAENTTNLKIDRPMLLLPYKLEQWLKIT